MAKLARVQAKDDVAGAERAEEALQEATDVAAKWGAEATRATTARLADAARASAQSGLAAIGTAAERQHEVAQAAVREVAEQAPAVESLFREQLWENLRLATAIRSAIDWDFVARIQREFVEGSFARMNQFGEAYRAALLDPLNAFAARR